MTLQRVTLQPDEPVFSAPIHRETANAPDKEHRSHVTYNVGTSLCEEPHGKATLVGPPAFERTNHAKPFSLRSWNGEYCHPQVPEGSLKRLFYSLDISLIVTNGAKPGSR